MYPVIVRVVLRAKDGTMGLSCRIELPFVPFLGLHLYGLLANPVWPEVLESVSWDLTEGCFYADLEDYQSDEVGIADLINHFGPSWELNEPCYVCEETD
jgi:hypothetical protein